MSSGSLLKRLDRLGWWPAAWVGRLLAVLLWPAPLTGSTTLVIRPGGMGDLVLLTLAFRELGISMDQVTWLIEKRSEVWARYLGLNYHCYDSSPIQVLFKILGRFDLVLNTEQFFGLSQAFALAARKKGGRVVCFSTNRGARFADEKVRYDAFEERESDAFGHLVAAGFSKPWISKKWTERTQGATGVPVVAVAGLQAESRQFDLKFWKTLVLKTCSQGKFILSGSPQDTLFVRDLAKEFEDRCEIFSGSFSDLCAQIAISPKLITVDGGMVHIASYFGVPSNVIFTAGRASKWAPLGKGSAVMVRTDLKCQPCTLFGQVPPCDFHFECKKLDLNSEVFISNG
ncbi:MAG: hypothetical protein HYX41_00150 [Bdellovibrio sp.]|nr:hypothetical protein [Bdellovibrio sp.]